MARLRVREIAETQGLDATKLARLANVGYNIIRAIFNDPDYNPTFETLQKIAQALNVKVTELIVDDPPKTK